MTVTPPNYNTITIQDGSLEDDTKQGQTESTTTTHTFLPSSLLIRKKWWVTVLVVIFGGMFYLTGGLSRPPPIQGTQGTCRPSPPSSSSLTIMTFNTYLIYCLPFGLIIPCEEAERREERLPPMVDWFAQRDEDVVLLQEIWSFRDDVRFALTEQAGYCHYTMAGGDHHGWFGLGDLFQARDCRP